MSLFFRRPETRAMESWLDADGFVRRPSEQESTSLGPVYAAIRHIIDFGSTLPVDCYRKDGERRTPVTLPRVLARQDEQGGIGLEQWIGQALYGIAAHGNAVGWVPEHDGWGYPLNVIWLAREEWMWSQAEKRWYVLGAPVSFANVVHIPWLVPPGKRLGLSPIEYHAPTIKAGLSAQEYADMKRGGGMPPLILRNTEKPIPDPEKAETLSDRLVARLAKGKPFVHGKDWDLSSPVIPPNHAQFIATLKLTANQIAAIYGIDPTEIGGEAANSLTYTTEELRQIRRGADMRPYLTRMERAITRMLPNRQYVKFNLDAPIRVDVKTRTEVVGAQIQDGRLNVDEARALEDRGPVPGGTFHNVPAPKQEPNTRGEGVTP